MNEYLVIYEEENGSWGAWCPDVDCVFAAGKSREEVESLMKEALEGYFSYLRETGEKIPEPSFSEAGFVAA